MFLFMVRPKGFEPLAPSFGGLELRAQMALPARFELAAYRLGGGRSIRTELWEQLKDYIIAKRKV